jgi:two-component system, chemotaxis family, sensor kinase Cph1
VLAVKLSTSRPDYLMWFRKEQLLTVTWAGDPSKPMVANNPLELSPRSSFAAWSEIVRGTALPWSNSELALGRAFGASLIDIIVQINAVRLLIAEHQLGQIRTTVQSSGEPVVISDARGQALFASDAFASLTGQPAVSGLGRLPNLFTQPERVDKILQSLGQERQPWRGELVLALDGGKTLPVTVRAEVVPARDGSVLGFFLILVDLTDSQRASEARRRLERSLSRAIDETPARVDERSAGATGQHDVIGAILANASLAAMDIADGSMASSVAPLLAELEVSTLRATQLFGRIRLFDS